MTDTETGAESSAAERTDSSEGNDGREIPKGNREARYRTERNEARAQRDALVQRIEQLQTRELERIASKSLSNPADLLTLSGKTLADFVGDDGELDAELIAETVNDVLGSRPGLRPPTPAHDRSQGYGSQVEKAQPSWDSFLEGATR